MSESQRQRAIAGLETYIDVLSAWSGKYEDDDRPAGIDWIMEVIPERSKPGEHPRRGWIGVKGHFGETDEPGVWWTLDSSFSIGTVCHSLKGKPWPVTRKEFREACKKSGVSLPSIHATIYRRECKHADLNPEQCALCIWEKESITNTLEKA